MADTECDVSERCVRCKNMELPLTYFMMAYVNNKFEKETNAEGIINMGTSENKIIADIVLAQLNKHNEFKEEHAHYGPFEGTKRFCSVMAAFFEHYMRPLERIDPKNIIIFNGCASVIKCLSACIFNPGEGILIPAPYYAGFNQDLFIENEIVRIPVNLSSKLNPETNLPFQLTLNDLEAALNKAKKQNLVVRGLLLCNPNNPLGTVYSEKLILECMEFAERHSLHLISDEIYMLSIFKEGVSMKSALAVKGPLHPDRLHIVWGFSKDFGLSGVRAAALHSRNEDILTALRNIAPFYAIAIYLQAMLESLVTDYDWLDNVLIPTNHKRLRECHSIVTRELERNDIPFVPSCSGLFIWVDLRKYLNPLSFDAENHLAKLLLENGAYINAGRVFSCAEPGWYRVVIASDPTMIKLGIERVVNTLKQLKNNQIG